MKRWRATSILITVLLLLTVITGLNYFAKPFSRSASLDSLDTESPTERALIPSNKPIKEETSNLISQLSLTELAWQVLAVPVVLPASASSVALDELERNLPATAPGVFTLFGEDISSDSAQLFADMTKARYPSHLPWLAVDHEGGTVQRLSGRGFTQLPSWRRMCQMDEIDQTNIAATTAAELRAANITLVFGPVLDLASASGVLGTRVCSDNPEQVASVASQFVSAYIAQGLIPVIKHYPGIGSVGVDLHNQVGSAQVTPKDVAPFHDLLQKFPLIGVMTAHVAPDSASDIICTRNPECISELTNSYPKALVVTDALDMKSARYNAESKLYDISLAQVAGEALLAGNDLLVFGKGSTMADLEQVAASLVAAAQQDPEVKKRLVESAEKIISYKAINSVPSL